MLSMALRSSDGEREALSIAPREIHRERLSLSRAAEPSDRERPTLSIEPGALSIGPPRYNVCKNAMRSAFSWSVKPIPKRAS